MGNYIQGYKLATGKKVNKPPLTTSKPIFLAPAGGGCHNPSPQRLRQAPQPPNLALMSMRGGGLIKNLLRANAVLIAWCQLYKKNL